MPDNSFIDTTDYVWVDLPDSSFQDTVDSSNVVRLVNPRGSFVSKKYRGCFVSKKYRGVFL